MKHKHVFLAIVLLVIAAGVAIGRLPTKEGLDLKGGMRVILRAVPEGGQKLDEGVLSDAKNILQRRVDGLGVSEPLVQTKGKDQIVVELPDIAPDKRDEALKQFQKLAMLRFIKIPEKYDVVNGDPPTFQDKITKNEVPTAQVMAEGEVVVTGKELLPGEARGNIGGDGSTIVELRFNKEGRQKFADYTKRNVKKYFGIFLDDEPISVPIVEEPIPGGDGVIRGSFSLEEAQGLANLLNAGALPIPLRVDSHQEVGATLGRDSVHKSIIAGIIGLVLVALFMMLYYKVPGIVSVVALLFYSTFVFALFKIIPVTLTLPGIAGFILSIGMAVDANILIFERLKEELNLGKTLRAAIDAGFSRAFPSIFDSNACTIITCAVLYNFGTGPIRGFAVVLALGVAVSMFTAITCTRTMLYLLVGTGASQKPNLWGLGTSWLHREPGNELKIIEKSKTWFSLSGAVILAGLLFMGLLIYKQGSPINKGIDFTGGSLMQLRYEQTLPQVAEIKKVLEANGRGDSQIATSSPTKTVTIRGKFFPADAAQQVIERDKIEQGLTQATGKFQLEAFDNVGPVMGKELTRQAILAVIFASFLIILYLWLRFSSLDFGVTAVMALVHDVLVLLGLFAIAGWFLHWEVDSLFVTAALTVIGFSVHDTIVVFDRIRENLRYRQRGESFDFIADKSVSQTLARSINTSGTVVLVLLALVFFGGATILQFNVALLIGIVAGTYSSIFTASPLLAMWRRYQHKQAQAAARKPEERSMVGGGPSRASAPRPQPRPAAAPKPAAPMGVDSDDFEKSAMAPGGGMTKVAPRPNRNIKKKKRRY